MVISQATRRLVGGLFELDDLGRSASRASPSRSRRGWLKVRAVPRAASRRDRPPLTPLVGREEEIALLLRRWRAGQGRRGAGGAALGRARDRQVALVRELRERLAGEPSSATGPPVLAHHRTSPLRPVIDHLERAAASSATIPEGRLAKLEALLAHGTDKLDQAVPLIAALLGDPDRRTLSAARVTRSCRASGPWKRSWTSRGARGNSRCWWSGRTYTGSTRPRWSCSGLAIERTKRIRCWRSSPFDRSSHRRGRPAHIARCGSTGWAAERAAIVDRVVGDKALPDEVTAQIVAKTDGVPLFVEELTKTVLESGLLADAATTTALRPLPPLAIPATLHDSLLARLDASRRQRGRADRRRDRP